MASSVEHNISDTEDKCPNCGHPLARSANYCPNCGQKNADVRITIGTLIHDFFEGVLNFDSKIWLTLVALLVPGKLTQRFFAGKHQRYIKPVRLFFIFAVLAVAAISFFESELLTSSNSIEFEGNESLDEVVSYNRFLDRTDFLIDSLKDEYPAQSPNLLDSLQIYLRKNKQDSTLLGGILDYTETGLKVKPMRVAQKDVANLSVDSLIAKYQVDGFLNQLILRQSIRLRLKGEDFNTYILNKTVWMMLLLMPILALLLKLIYVRRNRYYVEHLIFSFHVHTFIFLLLIVLVLLNNWGVFTTYMPRIWIGSFLLAEIYFFIALKRVYQQGLVKTWVKFLVLNLGYLILFILSLLLTIILAALFY